jgi:hypothetical protein
MCLITNFQNTIVAKLDSLKEAQDNFTTIGRDFNILILVIDRLTRSKDKITLDMDPNL